MLEIVISMDSSPRPPTANPGMPQGCPTVWAGNDTMGQPMTRSSPAGMHRPLPTCTWVLEGTGSYLCSKVLKESSCAQPVPSQDPPAHLCARLANSDHRGASNFMGLIYAPCSSSSPVAQAHQAFIIKVHQY